MEVTQRLYCMLDASGGYSVDTIISKNCIRQGTSSQEEKAVTMFMIGTLC